MAPTIREKRPLIVGPDNGPEAPYPIRLGGKVIKGFGRGSADLGIPTANIPLSGLSVGGHSEIESGIYFGYAGLNFPHGEPPSDGNSAASGSSSVYPMVMSIGWNPFYKNTVRSVEVHIIYPFPCDFYGSYLNLTILGFIRPELDYISKESLILDIRTDISVAESSLERPTYSSFKSDSALVQFPPEERQAIPSN